jgi:hypothetical protein
MAIAYSFADVSMTLVGPGGIVSLGYGSATAEEGITIEQAEDKDTMTVGADGEVMHSLHAGKHGAMTVRLLKTSPANALLQAMYDFQTLSSASWGLNVLVVTHVASGDTTSGRSAAFRRSPNLTYAKDGGINEWGFNVGKIDKVLGSYAS